MRSHQFIIAHSSFQNNKTILTKASKNTHGKKGHRPVSKFRTLPFEMQIDLVPYNLDWPAQFSAIKERLLECIAHLNPVIEHIGSTSVPGLTAKPTIDIQIGMPGMEQLDALHDCLLPAGFTRNARWDEILPFRRFFVLLEKRPGGLEIPKQVNKEYEGDLRTEYISKANIHCTEINHTWFADHVLFRDYLRQHPEDCAAYQAVKEKLAKQEWNITADYAKAKDEIIGTIKKKMYEWQHEK